MARPERLSTAGEIRLERRLPTYWRVSFDLPPVNIFGPKEIPQLDAIVTAIEQDERLKVVVFDSAVDGFFLTHYDFLAPLEESAKIPPGPTGYGESQWPKRAQQREQHPAPEPSAYLEPPSK